MMNNTDAKHQEPSCAAPVWACLELPVTDYMQALRIQQNLVSARAGRELNHDIVLILQHFPVFTLGNQGGAEHLHVSEDFLKARGISLVETGRGGSITYHGPGQLVAYPIVDLAENGRHVADFVHALETVMLCVACQWGLPAGRDALGRGVWVRGKKIGSVGLRAITGRACANRPGFEDACRLAASARKPGGSCGKRESARYAKKPDAPIAGNAFPAGPPPS